MPCICGYILDIVGYIQRGEDARVLIFDYIFLNDFKIQQKK